MTHHLSSVPEYVKFLTAGYIGWVYFAKDWFPRSNFSSEGYISGFILSKIGFQGSPDAVVPAEASVSPASFLFHTYWDWRWDSQFSNHIVE